MTKTQLITKLKSKFDCVEEDVDKWSIRKDSQGNQIELFGYKLYYIPVLEANNLDSYSENQIPVYVKGSDYRWRNGEPMGPAYQFRKEVEQYIVNEISGNSNVVDVIIDHDFGIDSVNQKARAKVLIKGTGETLTRKEVMIDKDENGDLRYRVIQ